jgi:hypothetical protein
MRPRQWVPAAALGAVVARTGVRQNQRDSVRVTGRPPFAVCHILHPWF